MKNLRDYVLQKNGLPTREEQRSIDLARRQEAEKKNKIKELSEWFESYDRKVAEHNRCVRLGLICEHNIIELDIEAEIKRSQLKELKK